MQQTNYNPVRLGLVGLNFGGGLANRQIFGQANEKFVKIVAVCDLDRAKADKYAAEHGNLPAYYSLSDILADEQVEAIMLMIPPAGRSAAVQQCLAANKHVLTTKPFDLDPASAQAALEEAAKRKLTVHLNSPAPHPSDDLQQIRLWQKKFDLGNPVSAYWETYAEYHEQADGSWFDSFEKCPAAPIFRIGIYGINELVELLGEPEKVELATSRISTGRPTPDNAQLTIKFTNGAIGTVYAALCIGDGQLYPSALTVHFEHGTIYKRQCRKLEERDFQTLELRLTTVRDGKFYEEQVTLPAANRSGGYQYDKFYEAVRNNLPDTPGTIKAIVSGVKALAMMAEKEKMQ